MISSEICLAQMPNVRAVFLDRGESFDPQSLKELGDWAVANDIQVFITIVRDIPEKLEAGTFYISEGKVLEAE